MRFDVGALATQTDLSVDTIRYYQSIGILHSPEREGRRAFYDQSHLDRIERVKTLAERGFSLKAIHAVLEAGTDASSDGHLLGAIEEELESTSYTAAEIASKLGIPASMLASVEKAGLAEPVLDVDGSKRYSSADLRIAAGAAKLLRYGFPFARLIRLAIKHDRAVRKTIDEAIDLFDDRVRKQSDAGDDPEAVAAAFRELLPVVSALVAHHFQRVLINRALTRLKRSGRRRAFKAALEATTSTRDRAR
jgi:DNA-binding transcriptional MerR regulator